MSGLACVIPSNCCSMTVGRCVCVCVREYVFRKERKRESVSVCMTRGCIRGAGTDSLERRGRAGVTNQLWGSSPEKTHPLFSPQREREGTDKTNLFRPKPLQMNGYHQKYHGGRKQRCFPPHPASRIFFYFFPPFFFIPAVTNANAAAGSAYDSGGYPSACAHLSTDG